MNEKLYELAGAAKISAECSLNMKISFNTQLKAFAEKFAELIIQECCEVLREEVEVALSAVGDVAYPERLVRKHFGVEE